ncbi:hypothetical protein J4419_02985 [Candidatus Woesearchaeota archaeon]|nr:hypothetical protein [Candidatus Woesearchaeota archaeon]
MKTIGLMAALATLAGCASTLERKVSAEDFPLEQAPVLPASEASPETSSGSTIHLVGKNAVYAGRSSKGTAEARVFTEVGMDFTVGDTPYTVVVKSVSFVGGEHYSDVVKAVGDTSRTMIRFGPKKVDEEGHLKESKTLGLVNVFGGPDKTTAELGVWDTHIKDWLGLTYGRMEASVKPDGTSAHTILDMGKEFELPWGRFGIEYLDGYSFAQHTKTGSFQELEFTQTFGDAPFYGYLRFSTVDHRMGDITTTVGVALDVGKLVEKLTGK